MRKLTVSSFLLLLSIAAGARDDGALSISKSLWFHSHNASGLIVTPLDNINTASAGYDFSSGEFHLQQEGTSRGTAFFDTQGSVKVGKVNLWGHFAYNHISVDGSRYNTLVYDPFDERYIYGVADTTSSRWIRQKYDLEFKAAVPFVQDRLYGGIHVRYLNKIASKQNDPRAESYNYEIIVEPSLTFRAGASTIGLSASYSNSMERSVPTLSNDQLAQSVFVLRGLGNYIDDVVGSGGIETMYFRTNLFGGALQYGLDNVLLIEAGANWSSTELSQSPTQPRPMGRSNILDIYAGGFYSIHGNNFHRIGLSGAYTHTVGTEYSTKAVAGEGWIIATESSMSTYNTVRASASYDCFITEGNDWKWDFNAKVSFTAKDDRYLAPVSSFNWSSLGIDAKAARKVSLKSSSVLKFSASLLYVKGLSGKYSYSGSRSTSRTVTEWYPSDLAYRMADRYGAGLGIDWGKTLKNNLELHIAVDDSFLRSSLSTNRNAVCGKIYLVF